MPGPAQHKMKMPVPTRPCSLPSVNHIEHMAQLPTLEQPGWVSHDEKLVIKFRFFTVLVDRGDDFKECGVWWVRRRMCLEVRSSIKCSALPGNYRSISLKATHGHWSIILFTLSLVDCCSWPVKWQRTKRISSKILSDHKLCICLLATGKLTGVPMCMLRWMGWWVGVLYVFHRLHVSTPCKFLY